MAIKSKSFSTKSKKKSDKKRRAAEISVPSSWNTTDVDEINRRRIRAKNETMQIQILESSQPYFGDYSIKSVSLN